MDSRGEPKRRRDSTLLQQLEDLLAATEDEPNGSHTRAGNHPEEALQRLLAALPPEEALDLARHASTLRAHQESQIVRTEQLISVLESLAEQARALLAQRGTAPSNKGLTANDSITARGTDERSRSTQVGTRGADEQMHLARICRDPYLVPSVPDSLRDLENIVMRWISKCVTSRTNTLHREVPLVRGNPSLAALHRRLSPGSPARIYAKFFGHFRVERIEFQSPDVIKAAAKTHSRALLILPKPKGLTGPPSKRRLSGSRSPLLARRLDSVLRSFEKRIVGFANWKIPLARYKPAGPITPFASNAQIRLSLSGQSYPFYLNESYYGFVLRYHDRSRKEVMLERDGTAYVYPEQRFTSLFGKQLPANFANGALAARISWNPLQPSMAAAWGKYHPSRLNQHDAERIERAIHEIRIVPGWEMHARAVSALYKTGQIFAGTCWKSDADKDRKPEDADKKPTNTEKKPAETDKKPPTRDSSHEYAAAYAKSAVIVHFGKFSYDWRHSANHTHRLSEVLVHEAMHIAGAAEKEARTIQKAFKKQRLLLFLTINKALSGASPCPGSAKAKAVCVNDFETPFG